MLNNSCNFFNKTTDLVGMQVICKQQMCLAVKSFSTVVSTLQGVTGCLVHPLKFVPKVKKSTKIRRSPI